MSKLLINERPLQVLPSLVKATSLQEAVVLQQIQYWITINERGGNRERHYHEGRWWTYSTAEEWSDQFSFWGESTVRKWLGRLRERGVLLTGYFSSDKRDRTLWYSIDYDVLDSLTDGVIALATDVADGADDITEQSSATVSADVYKESKTPTKNPSERAHTLSDDGDAGRFDIGETDSTSKPLELYRQFYPDAQINYYQRDLIKNVKDLPRWQETLSWWKGNNYVGKNVKRILQRYSELEEEKVFKPSLNL